MSFSGCRDRSGGLFVSVGGPLATHAAGGGKRSLSISEQVGLLEARGLVDEAGHLPRALMTHGYFRLSGYWRYFQIDPSAGRNAFLHGTEFLEVLDIYRLDSELRNLLLEGISEVEVALRASLIANLCTPGGLGTEYLHETTYSDRVDASGRSHRAKLLSDIRDDIARSKERHVRHHRLTGDGSVPLWVATEAMSFGTLSRMFGLLADRETQRRVAKRFGYDDGLFSSAPSNLRAVAVFRNVCAHHSRIWNRPVQQDQPRLFSGAFAPGVRPRDFVGAPWGVISVLGHMVMQVRNDTTFADAVHRLVTSNSLYWQGVSDPSDA